MKRRSFSSPRRSSLWSFVTARMIIVTATQMQNVAIGWHILSITGSALSLGCVGLAQFLPAVCLALISGHVVDHFERRIILAASFTVQAACSVGFLMLLAHDTKIVWPFYCLVAGLGAARAFAGPSFAALLPNLVDRPAFPRAVALSTSSNQIATVIGPAIGGVVLALSGPGPFAGAGILYLVGAILILRLPKGPAPQAEDGETWEKLVLGISYVRSNRILLGVLSLDLFALLLGGVTALLPIFARDILATGPFGLGLLRAGPACGAVLVGTLLAKRPLRRAVGRKMLWCVAGYGIATTAFALSKLFWLSLLAMVAVGGFDMVSMVVRETLVQIATPDHMRGRVGVVNHVFNNASNQLGDFEAGVVADAWGVVTAAVFGGLGTLLVVALWSRLFPELVAVDRFDEHSTVEATPVPELAFAEDA